MPSKDDKCGALWFKSKNGKDYFSGEVEVNGAKLQIVVFQNGYKDHDKKPDWLIYKSRPKSETPF